MAACRWAPWLVASVWLAMIGVHGATGFAVSGPVRGLRLSSTFRCSHTKSLPRMNLQQENQAKEELGDNVPYVVQQKQSKNIVGRVGEFAVQSVFSSDYYVGTKQFHLGVPLPREYPDWYPSALKVPELAYEAADRLVDAGLIGKGSKESTYAIRFGLFREEISPEAECEPCEAARRLELQQAAAQDLVSIDAAERERRLKSGYALLPVSAVLGTLAVLNDVGPPGRFAAAFIAVLGVGYIESGKTGL